MAAVNLHKNKNVIIKLLHDMLTYFKLLPVTFKLKIEINALATFSKRIPFHHFVASKSID